MNMPTTRYECTISTCDWKHDQPGLGPEDIRETGSFAEGTYRLSAQVTDTEVIIRAHFETHTVEEWAREVASLREQLAEDGDAAAELAPAPASKPWVPMCTLCLTEAKEAQLRGITPPEVNGVAVFANGVGICEIRHGIQVGPPKLLVAQPGQVSSNGFGG